MGNNVNFNKIKLAIYALFLTNKFGLKLKQVSKPNDKKSLRVEYSKTLLKKLKIDVEVKDRDKLPLDGQFLLISNHRGIIDPLVVELALEDTSIYINIWVMDF